MNNSELSFHCVITNFCRFIAGNTQIKINSDEDIEAMRVVGKLARECLDEGAKACGVGVTTDEIDRVVHEGT